MKTKILFTGFIFLSLLLSCSKDISNEEEIMNGKATLSFATVLNDLAEKNPNLKQSLNDLPECSESKPVYVDVILFKNGNRFLGSMEKPLRIEINSIPSDYDHNGMAKYFTKEASELKLDPGTYTLEYFKVLDEKGKTIWIAPRKAAEADFTNLVNSPLPLQIQLEAGVKKYVNVDVLCYDRRLVNEYGYLFFEIEGVKVVEFCIFGNYCDEIGRHYLSNFKVSGWIYSGNPNAPKGKALFSDLENGILITDYEDYGEVSEEPLCVQLPDGAGEDSYYLEITILPFTNDIEDRVIRSGVISDAQIRTLIDEEGNLDYYHFREGNCNLNDSPEFFNYVNTLPRIENQTSEETAEISFTSVTISGTVQSGDGLGAYGVVWGTSPNPTLADNSINEMGRSKNDGSKSAFTFKSRIGGLNLNQSYYFRIYATNQYGTSYGETIELTTLSLVNTKWDFYFSNNNVIWHADVTFYEDGKVFYTEPLSPDLYDYWGIWTVNGTILSYDLLGDGRRPIDYQNYFLTGTILDSTMSGNYTFFDGNKNWEAVKYTNE